MDKLRGCLSCLVNGGLNDKEVELVLNAIDNEADRTHCLLPVKEEVAQMDPAEVAQRKKDARDYARLTARVAHLRRQ